VANENREKVSSFSRPIRPRGPLVNKVTRDRLMLAYHAQFPEYGFAAHKGYGTAQHLAALGKFGPCPIHRKSFGPLKPKQPPPPELF